MGAAAIQRTLGIAKPGQEKGPEQGHGHGDLDLRSLVETLADKGGPIPAQDLGRVGLS